MNPSGKPGPTTDISVTPLSYIHTTEKVYTGIGSREIPNDIEKLMFELGYYLAKRNFKLRSGGAEGSDEAFENGCLKAKGKMDIFLPWNNFNNKKGDGAQYHNTTTFSDPSKAIELVSKVHPVWNSLKASHKLLHTRNAYQVLGSNLNYPSSFVICYAKPTGLLTVSGGTNTAVMLAIQHGIPVFNLYKPTHRYLIELIKNTDS